MRSVPQIVPDFVVADPKKAPVWEIIGAEFSRSRVHTADGISIRFPRVHRFRDDKTWQEAIDLPRLQVGWIHTFLPGTSAGSLSL